MELQAGWPPLCARPRRLTLPSPIILCVICPQQQFEGERIRKEEAFGFYVRHLCCRPKVCHLFSDRWLFKDPNWESQHDSVPQHQHQSFMPWHSRSGGEILARKKSTRLPHVFYKVPVTSCQMLGGERRRRGASVEVHSLMLMWRPEVYGKYLPLYSPLTFCESGSHRTWNLPFCWPMRPRICLSPNPESRNSTHRLCQVFNWLLGLKPQVLGLATCKPFIH